MNFIQAMHRVKEIQEANPGYRLDMLYGRPPRQCSRCSRPWGYVVTDEIYDTRVVACYDCHVGFIVPICPIKREVVCKKSVTVKLEGGEK